MTTDHSVIALPKNISLCFRLLAQADVFVEQLCQASKGHLTKLLTNANWSGHHERNSHVYCLR
ncbi:hypothetical protein T08_4490 [Trichinella sp. T8]|uniref:Uncharacterized protein n=1 Tax=Trichinella murrelli TaxID=144512 RepID=A0A0V0T9A5_9BILA|nr:hypothetical protein T05_3053 [Trichinella murrelli]KRZ93518.1 hypothetical protein T08_4490 [Trichinella sp. T8]